MSPVAFYLSVFPYFYSYLLVVQNESVTSAGHITQIFTFTATVTSLILSFVIKYTKRYKPLVVLGAVVYIFGLILMIRYRRKGIPTSTLVICQVALGIGGSLIHVPAQLGVQASARHQEVGASTALFLTLLEIGGAVGSAISGAIWTNGILPKLRNYLPADLQDQALTIYGSVAVAADYKTYPSGSPGRLAIDRAYQETMTMILIVAVIVAIPLLPLSLCMKDYRLDQMDQHVKGTVIGSEEAIASDEEETEPLAGPTLPRASSDSFGTGEGSSRTTRTSLLGSVRRKNA